MEITVLQANNGDSIHITFEDEKGQERNILIDGGKKQTFQYNNQHKKKTDGPLKNLIDKLKSEQKIFDLIILTHIDEDHIGGFISWIEFEPDEAWKMIGEVWFNSGEVINTWLNSIQESILPPIIMNISNSPQTSVPQGIQFEDYLNKHKLWNKELYIAGRTKDFHGMTFKFLSPDKQRLEDLLLKWKADQPNIQTSGKVNDHQISLKEHHENNQKVTDENFKEDDAVPNGSSLAFILSYMGDDFLFLGDSFPSVVSTSLKTFGFDVDNPLPAKLVKISHHGAQSNTSPAIFKSIKSDQFVISTNSKQDNHPHKQLLGRLIDCHPGCTIYFNYGELIGRIFTKQDYSDFPKFKAVPIVSPFKY
ncbi:MAG TPA: Zn-dependent hydrolase [Flavobacteriaceae bacterium]|nr:Zn-dependent hydrolase [Flavobacteriaceae bacterium]